MTSTIEWAQILERYRHLSRDFQQKFQSIQSKISEEKIGAGDKIIRSLRDELEELDSIFQDFNSWIYLSLLEDLDEARINNAKGLLSISSKVKRVKVKLQRPAEQARISLVDDEIDKDISISTYVTFFEQLLGLLTQNALKYAPKSSKVYFSTIKRSKHVILEIYSEGPIVEEAEEKHLSEKGFRAEAAIATEKQGKGYGLYNCRRICELLNINMSIKSERQQQYKFSDISYCGFRVTLEIPYEL